MNACPPDEELLPLADAESGALAEAAVRLHVASCPLCTRRKERMSAEMRALRDAFSVSQSVILRSPAKAPQGAMPATIGKYVIISALGAGGQAMVYRAAHKGLGREVVIKLARRSVKPGDVDLLAAEGKILAELDHPNIARVHDLDVHEGLPYLVMEFVRGRTLEEFAKQKKITPAEAAAIVGKVAGAIAYAQSRSVSHQDISPRNIIMSESGQPIVIDFGLAKLGNLWADASDYPSGGTPSYMAPEQARLEPGRSETRVDVFSLGAVLHFLLTGRSPYRAEPGKALETAKAGNIDIAAMENVPAALREIVSKALAANPGERFGSASQLADALESTAKRTSGRRTAIFGALAIAAIVGIAAWIALGRESKPAEFPVGGQEILRVTGYDDAAEALPLREGDRVRVEARIARGARAAAYWIANGKAVLMPITIAAGKDFDIVSAPAAGSDVAVTAGSGTEAVIIIASRTKLDAAGQKEAIRFSLEASVLKEKLGDISPGSLVAIDVGGSSERFAKTENGRPIDLTQIKPLSWAKAIQPIESTLKALTDLEQIDYYTGAAFTVRGGK